MTLLFNLILLQAEAAPEGDGGLFGGGALMNVFFIVAMIGVFYFFMIRPQMQKQKEEQAFRESLSKGDKVVTIGGIHGKIASIEEKVVILEVHNGTKLRMDASAIRGAVGTEQTQA